MIESTLEITQDTFDMIEVRETRVMHIQTSLLDSVCNFWTSMGHVLKITGDAKVESRIRIWVTFSGKL